eukprot:Nk52_evm13s166 gene=Nk52_evmTU13s166
MTATEGILLRFLTVALCVVSWYTLSIGLTFYNKWLFHTYDLSLPLTITTVHMFTTYFVSVLARSVLFMWTGIPRVKIPWGPFLKQCVPCGVASCLDIACSNMSLMFITVSLYTMVKGSSIVFLLLFAFILRVEKPKFVLFGIVVLISSGVVLATYGDTSFCLEGFLLILFASAMHGLRWVIAQKLLHKEELGLNNPIDTIYHVAPVMGVCMIPLVLLIEGPAFLDHPKLDFQFEKATAFLSLGIVMFGGVVAFTMNVVEFLVISLTSSVTMSVAGIFKEICTIVLAVVFLGERLSVLNVLGLIISLVGISSYNAYKFHQRMYKDNNYETATGSSTASEDYEGMVEHVVDFNEEDEYSDCCESGASTAYTVTSSLLKSSKMAPQYKTLTATTP